MNPLASFTVTAPASATAGTAFTVTVTAKNGSNATITGYVGTVHFTSSDPGSPVLPADYTFVSGDNGAHVHERRDAQDHSEPHDHGQRHG